MYNLNEGQTVRMTSTNSEYVISGVIMKSLKEGKATLGPMVFQGEPGSNTANTPSLFILCVSIDLNLVQAVFNMTMRDVSLSVVAEF